MSEQSQEALLLDTIVSDIKQGVRQLREYARAHPQASWAELEQETHRLSQGLLAPALVAVLEEGQLHAEGVACVRCGAEMHYKGQQERRQETLVGAVAWRRGYYYCRDCRQGRYPLDEKRGVGAGQFSPGVQEGVSRLAAGMPFASAAETCNALTRISMSAREVARIAEGRGRVLGAQQALEEQACLCGGEGRPSTAPPLVGTRAVALDAALTPFRDGWHETKVGVVFAAQEQPGPEEAAIRASGQHYLAHIGAMEQAGRKLYAQALQQGYRAAEETVVCLADGASANWEQFALHFPRRVEVLDWYHATEHLWAAGNGLYGEKSAQARAWVEERTADLWQGKVEAVLHSLQQATQDPRGEAAAAQIHYFSHNQERMRYDQYRSRGYPIGSGTVESACKQLVGARLCQAGMRWKQQGAQAILNLRAALLSGDWQQAWKLTQPPPISPKS
jgi:hypothetical protein